MRRCVCPWPSLTSTIRGSFARLRQPLQSDNVNPNVRFRVALVKHDGDDYGSFDRTVCFAGKDIVAFVCFPDSPCFARGGARMAIQRPVMDITYLDELGSSHGDSRGADHRARKLLRAAGRLIWRILRSFCPFLMYAPLARIRVGGRFRNEDGSAFARFLRGFAYRLGFVPILAALTACAFV